MSSEKIETPSSKRQRGVGAIVVEMLDLSAPSFFSALAFLAGAALLGAAAAPDLFQNRAVMRLIAPLPVVELSHFLASIIGTLLLFVAAGLRQRLDSAWLVSLILLGAGAVFSLLSGGHPWRALFLASVMVLLSVSRHAFYRRSALRDMALPPIWIFAVICVMAGIGWLGFFSFENVQYRDELWWTFATDAEASRFLRSLVTAGVVALLFIAWHVLRIRRAPSEEARAPELDAKIAAIIAEGDNVPPSANLAFLHDKRFLFSESGRSFIMYGVQGRNWIALGPPVGAAVETSDLAWAFKALADSYGRNIVFYSFTEMFLPIALDLGLGVQKIGESAVIPLETFSLAGGRRTRLRQARRALEKDGCVFEVLAPAEVRANLAGMRAVSDEWLKIHAGSEKRFSLGRFDDDYITRFPAAVVRKDGAIVAFSNFWAVDRSKAIEIDLMRYGAGAPPGVMDGLFVELALWAQAQDYRRFDLGMAPLAGIERRRTAPALSRLAAVIYEHGEGIYGFGGLRRYKEKFHPEWRPLYIAASSKLDAALALGGVALLTSGGLRGMFGGKTSGGSGKDSS